MTSRELSVDVDELVVELAPRLPAMALEMHYATGAARNVLGLRWAGAWDAPRLVVSLPLCGAYAIDLRTGRLVRENGTPLPTFALTAQLTLPEPMRAAVLACWQRHHKERSETTAAGAGIYGRRKA